MPDYDGIELLREVHGEGSIRHRARDGVSSAKPRSMPVKSARMTIS
jgi:hypothetical protein